MPPAIRALRAPGFRNVFELCDPPRLFGTETLCGDWGGPLLILSKDFGPSRVLEERIRTGDPDPWSHRPEWPTNRTVAEELAALGLPVSLSRGEGRPASCGVLFGSACWLLRADGRASGPLPPGWEVAGRAVVGFTLDQMEGLRAVGCLGADSFRLVAGLLGVRAAWREARDERRALSVPGRAFTLHALGHPGNLGTLSRLRGAPWAAKTAAVRTDWQALGRAAGLV